MRELTRAIQLVIIVAMFWAFLYVVGVAPAPNLGRLTQVGSAANQTVTGVAGTAGNAANAFEQGKESR